MARVGIQKTPWESAMTISMQPLLNTIGRQLHGEYSPTLTRSLPSDLGELVAQLVALEIREHAPPREWSSFFTLLMDSRTHSRAHPGSRLRALRHSRA
jgi:hypothetical protein